MTNPLILALDQGTTSCRAIVFNTAGEAVSVAQIEHAQHYPQSGWVEHDASEIWSKTLECARRALKKAEADGHGEVACIGITNQRETTVLWQRKSGRPVAPAIVWQDKRTTDFCAKLKHDGHEDLVRQKTGLTLDPYFSATKINWLLNHHNLHTAAKSGELAFGTIDAWLLWNLTDGQSHATDITNASRTLLFDIHQKQWCDTLLELFNIPRALLPDVKPNAADFGLTAKGLFPRQIPVYGMGGDQQCATFGQACFEAGMLKSTYGTGCFALLNTGEKAVPSQNGLLTTIAWQLGDTTTYALEGSIFIAGAAVQWLRDRLKIISNAAETESLAESLNGNKGVYLVPAFAGLGAPYWNSNARAALVGMSLDADRATVARATLESMAYQTYDLLRAMHADMTTAGIRAAPHALRVDGGMVRNSWLVQFMADILNVPIDRPTVTETTALGAAYFAGLGAGLYQSTADIAKQWKADRQFTPKMTEPSREKRLKGWKRAVEMVDI